MNSDQLDKLWASQQPAPLKVQAQAIIAKAKNQRKGQVLSILIMATTVLVLIVFTIYTAGGSWSDFTLGLTIMIGSLVLRIALEFASLFQKGNRLVSLDHYSFTAYLKQHYRTRRSINFFVTPLCFAAYIYGFTKLLPSFQQAFSPGFYIYILISGSASLLVLLFIIGKGILREDRFLRQLDEE